jgi:hypothetical protein
MPVASSSSMMNIKISNKSTVVASNNNAKALTKSIILKAFIGLMRTYSKYLQGSEILARCIE